MTRGSAGSRWSVLFAAALVTLLLATGTAWTQAAPVPFACTAEAFIVQNQDAQLSQVDQSVSPFLFNPVGGPAGTEYNNLGFRRSDGFLYAVELSTNGNLQILQIDSTGAVLGLGRPASNSLPTGPRFDAGDIDQGADTLYINTVGQNLYSVDLAAWAGPGNPLPAATSIAVGGGETGFVFDWAVHPGTSILYGGDRDQGQVARLDPLTGLRTDLDVDGCSPITPTCTATFLPGGATNQDAYGGAWFNSAGRLFLYRNVGEIYEIDLTTAPNPTIVSNQSGPGSTRNDGTACIQNNIGLAKQMTLTGATLPGSLTATFTFENLSATESLFNVQAEDNLVAVFGIPGVDWTFTSISSVPASFANPGFDGDADIQLVNQLPPQSLAPLETATITVVIEVLTPAGSELPQICSTIDNVFLNQVLVTAETVDGVLVGDVSTDGTLPDADGDGSVDDRVPSCVPVPPGEFPPPPAIPTLGGSALALFALLLLAASLVVLRRRRQPGA